MAFDTPDPCESICAAQVAAFNAHTGFSLPVVAQVPEDPNEALLAAGAGPQALFYPFSEGEEKIGRGGEVVETFTTTLLVSAPHDDKYTRTKLFAWVREIRKFFRGLTVAGYRYRESETVTKLDLDLLHKHDLLVSVVHFSYTGTDHR